MRAYAIFKKKYHTWFGLKWCLKIYAYISDAINACILGARLKVLFTNSEQEMISQNQYSDDFYFVCHWKDSCIKKIVNMDTDFRWVYIVI